MRHNIRILSFLALALPALAEHAPLPSALLQAKTAYIENRSADAKLADRAYDELMKWGRFQIVDDPAKADLILRFAAKRRAAGHTTTTEGQTRSSSHGGPGAIDSTKITTIDTVRAVSLSVIERHSRRSLWSDTKQNEFIPGAKDAARALVDELRERVAEQEAPPKPPPGP